MRLKYLVLLLIIFSFFNYLPGQGLQDTILNVKSISIKGFVRAGFYGDIHNNNGNQFVSSGYSDFGLKADGRLQSGYRAFADIRFRYGSEFHKPVNLVTIKEAYVDYSLKRISISAGQKIIKWGRADFTNPTSRLNPQNYVSRSPDMEDMDMGNLLASVNWFPSGKLNLQAVVVPFYRSSVLLIDPIPLPENVTIDQQNTLITDQKLFSYGLKADFHLRGIDFGASWFEGYDPMPGIALKQFSADFSGPVPVIATSLKITPYKTRVAGFDFETSAGIMGIRGEFAWSHPVLSYKSFEYAPLPELKWVAGIDFTLGNWRLTGEYSGKYIPGFEASLADPIIGTEPDYAKLAALLATPGFDLQEYIRQEIGSFNRLYNYQLEQTYHSAGLRVETDLSYGRILPSVFTSYNFTSKDLLVIPELKIKPLDGLTISIGAEVYSGKKGSLYYIIKDFMTSVYAGIKVDF